MVGAMVLTGVTVMLTIEVTETFDRLSFSPHAIAFLSENIVYLRYMELGGELRRVLTVVKMRSSAHSHELRAFDIGPTGPTVGGRLVGYRGILTGLPETVPEHTVEGGKEAAPPYEATRPAKGK
jgi:circadian clock protein KaiC